MSDTIFDEAGRYVPVPLRTCTRCGHVLVDEDELGPYYQVALTQNMGALYEGGPDTVLTFMDRMHTCDGKPHQLPPATEDAPVVTSNRRKAAGDA